MAKTLNSFSSADQQLFQNFVEAFKRASEKYAQVRVSFFVLSNEAARLLGYTGYTIGRHPIPKAVRSMFSTQAKKAKEVKKEEEKPLVVSVTKKPSVAQWWDEVLASPDPLHAQVLHPEDESAFLEWLEQQGLEEEAQKEAEKAFAPKKRKQSQKTTP